MKQESSNLRKNLSMLQDTVPEEMAGKISDLLLRMANDSLENMDDHLKLRQKHNINQIHAMEQKERFQKNLLACF